MVAALAESCVSRKQPKAFVAPSLAELRIRAFTTLWKNCADMSLWALDSKGDYDRRPCRAGSARGRRHEGGIAIVEGATQIELSSLLGTLSLSSKPCLLCSPCFLCSARGFGCESCLFGFAGFICLSRCLGSQSSFFSSPCFFGFPRRLGSQACFLCFAGFFGLPRRLGS